MLTSDQSADLSDATDSCSLKSLDFETDCRGHKDMLHFSAELRRKSLELEEELNEHNESFAKPWQDQTRTVKSRLSTLLSRQVGR